MAKKELDNSAQLIFSYLRVGSDIDTAFNAMAFNEKQRKEFLKEYELEIKQAIAQCRIVCLHNIMTEGGQSGARYILDQTVGETEAKEEPVTAARDDFDFGF